MPMRISEDRPALPRLGRIAVEVPEVRAGQDLARGRQSGAGAERRPELSEPGRAARFDREVRMSQHWCGPYETVQCPRCQWPFQRPIEQRNRLMCRACESKATKP